MRFRPCIDLHQGKVKQIVGSTLSSEIVIENFISERDSAWYAELFRSHKLKGGHVIMLGPGNNAAAALALQAWPGGMQLGGGINDDNAAYWLGQGASHVIVTSFIITRKEIDWDNLRRLEAAVGKKHIVIDLSCKRIHDDWVVMTNKWKDATNIHIDQDTLDALRPYCDELLIHAVDVEGKSSGIQYELLEHLATLDTVPLTYAGGIRSMEDIQSIDKIGGGRIDYTVGSALDLFGGQLKFSEIVGG